MIARSVRVAAFGGGSPLRAKSETRERWTMRSALSFAAIVACLAAPVILAQVVGARLGQELYLPVVATGSSLLVLVAVRRGRAHMTAGLRGAHPLYYVEGTFVAFSALILAAGVARTMHAKFPLAWTDMPELTSRFGSARLLLAISFCPAVVESLAVYGVLQGWVRPFFGRAFTPFVVALAFAATQGITPGFPIYVAFGVYLALLRERSGCLLPGMLTHLLFNAALVLTLAER